MPSLPDLDQLSPAQKDELIRALWQQVHEFTAHITVLQERIKQLEGQLTLHSRNSSRPPSSGGLRKPAPKSLRAAGKKPNGGQPGHSGNALRQSEHVDETIVHRSALHCSVCHEELHEHRIAKTRQVFELPPLAMRTQAHQQPCTSKSTT
ncbi:MAG: hypothetical protein JSR74_07030 [Proteobacteria bacterium]|nr:hypothetical protein [Pseudomonadota bacterium]